MNKTAAAVCAVLLAVSATASAIIIRDDTADAAYRTNAATLPALADFPGEGHGVLIAPQWVVTAAHVACLHMPLQEIHIAGQARNVQSVIVHPGFKMPSDALIQSALASADAGQLMAFLAGSDDIALVKLQTPVSDVAPVALYRGGDEVGKTVQLIGKGATGTGNDREIADGPRRTALRRAFNVISHADARWLSYRFDAPPSALPLEGMTGSGDSGSPVLIETGQHWQLAGLASWVSSDGELRGYPGARYGDRGNSVRISRYLAWIESAIAGDPAQPGLTRN